MHKIYKVLDYAADVHKKVNNICKKFLMVNNLCYFGYQRITASGQYIGLTSDYDWLLHYGNKEYFLADPFIFLPAKANSGYCFLNYTETAKDSLLVQDAREKFGIDHGMLFILKGINEVELFCFATSCKNNNIYHQYINSLIKFNEFCMYFKKESSFLISQANQMDIQINDIIEKNANIVELDNT